VRSSDIAILSPTEFARLLECASDETLPYWAIGGFAGLRSSELERLDWADVHLDSDLVEVPSSPSVEVFRAQGFARANTLQQFELNPVLQQAVKGQVLWVDEAGFLSVRQMLELEEFAVEQNCRLVVTGDTKQHHSVQRGDALRILERSGAIAQASLTKIHVSGLPNYVQRSKI
jgi:integrase